MTARAHVVGAADVTHAELAAMVGDARLVLEIGANDGTDTLEMLARYPRARIHCFECDPRPAARWSARMPIEDRHRVWLHETALGETVGEAEFHQSTGSPRPGVTDWDLSGSLCRPTGHLGYSPWCKFETRIRVPVTTLDTWAAARLGPGSPVDLLWIDVQGAEGMVFRGGAETLARTRWIKAECHRGEMYAGQPTEAEMIGMLPAFDCVGRWADDLLFRRRGA